jgi:hypothetical protein
MLRNSLEGRGKICPRFMLAPEMNTTRWRRQTNLRLSVDIANDRLIATIKADRMAKITGEKQFENVL